MFPKSTPPLSFSSPQCREETSRKHPVNAAGFSRVDVLSGRGGLANTHEGNRIFRRLVDLNKKSYHSLKDKHDKNILVESIVLAIRKQGGRFLKQNRQTGMWDEEIPMKQALLKTSQALREPIKERRPVATTVTAPPMQTSLYQGQEDDASCSTSSSTASSLPSSPPSSPPPTMSRDFYHVEACSDDEDDNENFVAAPSPAPLPPMLRMYSSAFNPLTSKIAGPIEDQRVIMDEVPPMFSFDDVLQRQESLGISGSRFMPELTYETSMVFSAALDLIDSESF